MGDANASIPTPQPVLPRPMWGAYGRGARADVAVVRRPGRPGGRPGRPARPRPRAGPGRRHPARGKADLANNDALPDIEVDPDTFTVRIDGEVVEAAPVTELPMAQRYFLF